MENRSLGKMLSIVSSVWRMACGYARGPADARSCGESAKLELIDWGSTFSAMKPSVRCWTKWWTLNTRRPSITLTTLIHRIIANLTCQIIAIVHPNFCRDWCVVTVQWVHVMLWILHKPFEMGKYQVLHCKMWIQFCCVCIILTCIIWTVQVAQYQLKDWQQCRLTVHGGPKKWPAAKFCYFSSNV